jgi:hypothetical protein
MRLLKLLAASTVLLASVAACGDDPPESTPNPSTSPTESNTDPGEPTSPTSPPAWQAKYSDAEIRAFEDAVNRLAAYEREAQPIWAKGKYTPEAEALFRRYFTTAPTQLQLLRDAERGGVQIKGQTTVLSSRPARLRVSKRGASTTVEQCVDETTSRLFQDGERVPEAHVPQLRTIVMTGVPQRAGDIRWYIASIVNGGGKRSCPTGGESA